MSLKIENRLLVEKCRSPVRWIVLMLACAMMVGSYYCFDIPAALKTQIDDYMGDPSDYEIKFGLLYTLYAAPNVILPFFGGYLVDSIGVRMSLLLFCALISVGQVVFTLGLQTKSWPIIFLGRLIFGFGGESFTVANSALLSEWFKGRELAFAFGVNLAISKLGSVFNNLLSPVLADRVDVVFALWFGCILCGLSLICVIVTILIDRTMDSTLHYSPLLLADEEEEDSVVASNAKMNSTNPLHSKSEDKVEDYADKDQLGDHAEGSISKNIDARCSSNNQVVVEKETATFRDVLHLKHIFWILVVSCAVVYGCILPFNNISSSLLLERDYFKDPGSSCHLQNIYDCQSEENLPVDCPSSRWYQPPLPYNATIDGKIYSPLSSDDIDCADDTWKNGCTKVYCDRQNKAESEASIIMSIPYIISAVLSPPLGFGIDLYGQRAVIALIAPMLLIVVHALLGYTSVSSILPLIGQGLAYTGFVSVLWPAIPLVVEDHITGLAFGVVASMQNLACAVIPLIVASIYSSNNDQYIPNVELLFVMLAVVGAIVGVYMNYYDFYYGDSILNSPCMLEITDAGNDETKTRLPSHETTLVDQTVGNVQAGEGSKSELRSHLLDVNSSEHRDDGREQRYSKQSRDGSIDGYSHGQRGASFTSYEEVLRAGGYRTSVAKAKL